MPAKGEENVGYYVKNPFGKRDGKLIMIGDLSPEERGSHCNCVCPECAGKFNARMGEKRRPHFAHEKNSMCDEEKVFLESMYLFLCNALEEEKEFCYPGLYGVYQGFDVRRKASRSNIVSGIENSDDERSLEYGYEKIISANKVTVTKADIQRNGKNLPEAILVYVNHKGLDHVLALRIIIPPNICKTYEAKRYKDYATIAISVTEELYTIKSSELRTELLKKMENKEWIYSPTIENWIDRQIKKQNEAHKAHIDRPEDHKLSKCEEERENEISEYLTKTYVVIPDEILNYAGKRWCFCEKCKTYRPARTMINFKSACRAECWNCPNSD